jgi:LmbE family N-acetylglucosaminyl deacetylase
MTVHAHPDDEASKGAPTVARYFAEGVSTVLVCCTGGEEGDLQNPALREPGQPFHEVTPEQERSLLAKIRPRELEQSTKAIGFTHVHMLGYRDSGMAGAESNNHPDCFHMADIDEATGRLVARTTMISVVIRILITCVYMTSVSWHLIAQVIPCGIQRWVSLGKCPRCITPCGQNSALR